MIIALYWILSQLSQKLAIHAHSEIIIILKGKLMRFINRYVDNVQQYMSGLQRKFVMLHIGPNLIILYLSLKKYINKIYALCSSQFLKN